MNLPKFKLTYVVVSLLFVAALLTFGIVLILVNDYGDDDDDIDIASSTAGSIIASPYPLLVLSFDGFRYDYVNRGLSPTLMQMMNDGVSVPYMKASYPTKTFPNHYTIVTGLYPESHGIIANSFYDESFGAEFKLGTDESLKKRYWFGNPVWNTVVQQGKKSATLYWPGSDVDIEGIRPTYWFPYNESAPFESRVEQILYWLALPEEERPDFICAYFNEPDGAGHEFGPLSSNVNDSLILVDSVMKLIVDGIDDLGMRDEVNLIVLADHGMAAAGESRALRFEDYLTDMGEMTSQVYSGAFARFSVDDTYMDQKTEIKTNLSCQDSFIRQYEPSELPTRHHFSNNPNRIEDIVMDLNPGYTLNYDSSWFSEGEHGYDNYFSVMQPIFAARGPSFHSDGRELEPFQNIELYNLMCFLLDVTPSLNNGTESSLYKLLASSPSYPVISEDPLPTSFSFPQDENVLEDRLSNSVCSGDLLQVEDWIYSLNLSSSEESSAISYHLPWNLQYGSDSLIPTTVGEDVRLLVYSDYVTGYSPSLRQALWISFTTIGDGPGQNSTLEWSSDPRLTQNETITCTEYETIANDGFTMYPLFPPGFSSVSSPPETPFIVSNSVPMSNELTFRWAELNNILSDWVAMSPSPVNVVVGPVFDNNADSYADTSNQFGPSPNIPSDLFMVITKCNDFVSDLMECQPQSLDAIGFIYPEDKEVLNCMTTDVYAREFGARVKDIEIVTNLFFFPTLESEDRIRLTTRIHSNIWTH